MVLLWQPPSCFSQWSPSSFVMDDVSYSCAKQFMMPVKTRFFRDRRAEELIMSSPDPRAHKRIGRGVRNLDNDIWDREDAVLASTFVKFAQSPAMKQHLLSTDTKRLAEASPFDSVWGIDLRVDDPEASNPRRWPGIFFSGKVFLPSATLLAQARLGWQNPAFSHQFCTLTSPDGIHETSPTPPRPMALTRACLRLPSEFST